MFSFVFELLLDSMIGHTHITLVAATFFFLCVGSRYPGLHLDIYNKVALVSITVQLKRTVHSYNIIIRGSNI